MSEEELLDELVKRLKEYNCTGDYSEVADFVAEQFKLAKLPVPDLEPD
jgi:hypothetical protein